MTVKVERVPEFVLKILRKVTPTTNESCLDTIEPELVKTLMEFQREAVLFGISKGGRIMLADDMGLGKTRQALAIADFYRDEWPLLIVTTAAMRNTWHEEICNLLPCVNVQDICIVETGRDSIYHPKVVICSYSSLKDTTKFLEKNFGVVIFDESHSLKNFNSGQTKYATKLGQKANRVLLLSGTPALSRPKELFPQLSIIDRSFADFNSYATRYCQLQKTSYGINSDGADYLDELGVILRKQFMIRRTKQEVYPELGEKQRQVIRLATTTMIGNIENAQKYYSAEENHNKQKALLEWFVTTAELKKEQVW